MRPTGQRFLLVLVFVVGAASLGTEIAAARLVAPYFGASTIVWANTIGVVLVALSVGYWIGGRLADRRPHLRGLSLLILAAAALLALVPFVARPFLSLSFDALASVSAGLFLGSLLSVLVLVAAPVVLLGAAAPYAIRLALSDVAHSGAVAGRLYAVSTAGSLTGTMLSALVLIPLVGTQRTFVAFALSLALVAALGLGWRFAPMPVALAAVLAVPPITLGSTDAGRVLFEGDTPYQYVRVIERPGGKRVMELNEGQAVHSLRLPGSYLTGGYWDGLLTLPLAALPRAHRVAILGNAGGTVARAYGHYFPQARVDAVEIDGELTDLGRRFFDLRNRRMRTYTEDARPFLERSDGGYDTIIVDAYRQPYVPFYLATREFFALARDRLAPGGVVVVNVGHPPGNDDLERVLGRTMESVFSSVRRDPIETENTLLVAGTGPLSGDRLGREASRLPSGLGALARAQAQRLRPPLPGGEVYTDDHAPVEWLIDLSILGYARGG